MRTKREINQPAQRGQSLQILGLLIVGCLIVTFLIFIIVSIPRQARDTFGAPSPQLGLGQTFAYSARLLIYQSDLTIPKDSTGQLQAFTVNQGETVDSITFRLESGGLIRNGDALRAYLIYTGLDTGIQAGNYELSPASTAIQIAHRLQDATPDKVTFVVLPGWRLEEIAAALPTSGLTITPGEFILSASNPVSGVDLGLPTEATSLEGFLFPDSYLLKRDITANEMVNTLLSDFMSKVTLDIREGFLAHGLDLYQGTILASIVQREAMVEDEQPVIASVFYNRMAAGMTLSSDPTVQYALGFVNDTKSWWKNPLSADDLTIDSPYNTYIYKGLPPGPIANPSLSALRAAAFPATTNYYYFRARCDGSHRHNFAETYQQHLQNACP
jgi:UPF0755 protein